MEHKPLVDLQTMAHLSPAEPHRPMTRVRRLERWIEALPRHPKRTLRPLREIEYQKPADQRSIRADDSAITVAYEDFGVACRGACRRHTGRQPGPPDQRLVNVPLKREDDRVWTSVATTSHGSPRAPRGG
jgi:hypothetical protein